MSRDTTTREKARQAVNCLYLELTPSIVKDVRAHVEDAFEQDDAILQIAIDALQVIANYKCPHTLPEHFYSDNDCVVFGMKKTARVTLQALGNKA